MAYRVMVDAGHGGWRQRKRVLPNWESLRGGRIREEFQKYFPVYKVQSYEEAVRIAARNLFKKIKIKILF